MTQINTVDYRSAQGLVNCRSCIVVSDSKMEGVADYVDVKQERNNNTANLSRYIDSLSFSHAQK